MKIYKFLAYIAVTVLFIGCCIKQATAQDSLEQQLLKAEWKLRTTQSDLEVAKSQLKTLNKQIGGLKSDTSRLAANAELNDQLYNECLDDVLNKMMDLQEIAFIVWGRKLGRVKRVKAVIDDKSCKQ